jgi:hypothetical protein
LDFLLWLTGAAAGILRLATCPRIHASSSLSKNRHVFLCLSGNGCAGNRPDRAYSSKRRTGIERNFAATSASTYGSGASLFLAKEEIDSDDSQDSLAVTAVSGFIQPNTTGFTKPNLWTKLTFLYNNYASD